MQAERPRAIVQFVRGKILRLGDTVPLVHGSLTETVCHCAPVVGDKGLTLIRDTKHIGTTSYNCYTQSVPPSENRKAFCTFTLCMFHETANLEVLLESKVFLSNTMSCGYAF